MALTNSEKERDEARAIARVLEIVADELGMIINETGMVKKRTQREIFQALYDNLTHRAKDYREASLPPQRGDVRVI